MEKVEGGKARERIANIRPLCQRKFSGRKKRLKRRGVSANIPRQFQTKQRSKTAKTMSQVELEPVRAKFRQHEKDTGSCDVQVAVLSKKIEHLTEHLKANTHDNDSRRGLIMMVNKRRKLLDYLKRTDEPRYIALVKELGLRR